MKPAPISFNVLAKSRNESATQVLLTALDRDDRAAFDGAAAALIARRAKAGHLAVLERWDELSPNLRELVKTSQGRMGGALREALLAGDDRLFAHACDVARQSGEFELAPTLITVAEQPRGPRSDAATELVVELVGRLVHASNEDDAGEYARGPESIRRGVRESLERSVERFAAHGRVDLAEAYTVLAGADSDSLRSILEAPHHACHQPIADVLERSQKPDVLLVLAAYLLKADAPSIVRHIAGRRTDGAWTAALLAMPLDPLSPALAKNIARIKGFACLASTDWACDWLGPAEQVAAMRLTALSAAADDAKLDLAAALLARGSVEARIVACEALQSIAGQRSNDLVLAALDDLDGDVQAAATRQLRERHIPGTMNKLISLAASPHRAVRDAARESLAEFSFDNYIAQYETLDDGARRRTGALVALVDEDALPRLRQEMACPVHRRRLRAIEVAEVMGVTAHVADALIERLDDDDHLVRAAAAEALAACSGDDVRNALLHALGDHSYAVQSAARNSLQALGVAAGAGPDRRKEIF